MPRILQSYDVVTPESAEDGCHADHGWIGRFGIQFSLDVENQADYERNRLEAQKAAEEAAFVPDEDDVVESTANYLRAEGVYGIDGSSNPCGKFCNHDWWIVFGDPDMFTGASTSYAFHPEGYTDAQLAEIDRRVRGRK